MKTKVKFLQFYIGNSCNLACPNCASFNNYNFKGQFSWENNQDNAKLWSEILDPLEVAIIGGEPFTNPNLDNWVYGLLEYFSPKDFRITTNGTFLERHLDKVIAYIEAGVNIEVSSHSDVHYELHNRFIGKHFPEKEVLEDAIVYRNGNKGFIEIRNATQFFNISVKEVKDGIFYMHNSNASVAHKNCPVSNCHYVVEGNLYQCVVTATTPMLAKQFKIDPVSLEKIGKIQSVSPYDSKDNIQDFLNKINKPCDQCSLCPTNIKLQKFDLPNKKVKL